MRKLCECGESMNLELRNLVYERKMEIRHVPVLTCFSCAVSEVPLQVADDIKKLIKQFNEAPGLRKVSFTDIHEWADVIHHVLKNSEKRELENWDQPLEEARQERINMLLDLYRFASDSGDSRWMNDVESRLKQLSMAAPDLLLSDIKR
ncbi:hypothetical protein OIN60_08735 [Paenibacillus sp. P96]|uniref:YgiT-type zinc finger protein n=1 Tax=Paenibacillus zeirhizosphaerae TaxID=2987519 RepID=A0ABT9FQ58_9BACL|nr:hypothetical protein [Paenibacillus sp. P96]MDP4096857.1 hypothetical protein [Paenibacillus sp. P96]